MNTQTIPRTESSDLGVPVPERTVGPSAISLPSVGDAAPVPHAVIVPSRMNYGPVPEFVGGLWFTDAAGRHTAMWQEEQDAIERSGRCSHTRYAFGDPPELGLPKAVEKIAAMEHRPGAIEPGLRPVQIVQVPRLHASYERPQPEGEWHLLDRRHLGGYPSCGKRANKADVFGFTTFGKIRTHKRICRACLLDWRAEFASDNGRRMK